MIILDTNVVSEPTKRSRSEFVLEWLNKQSPELLFFTAVSLSEMLAGIAVMPEGKRKAALDVSARGLIQSLFGPRILPFDERAAEAYAQIARQSHATGKLLPQADAQIAAIALSRGFAVATRDVTPFVAAGVEVINPWIGR